MTRLNIFALSLFLLFIGFKSFAQTPQPHIDGQWGDIIEFDIVPVAVANLPDGRLVTWSSKYHDHFDMNDGYTFTQIFDPNGGLDAKGGVLPRTVTETFHDMFCPGINNLPDGRLLVTGGSSDEKTSIYDPKTGIWTADENMKVARGYQGAVTLADGSAFTIGGSWNDGVPAGGRDGEIWRGDAAEGQRWTHLTGLPGSLLYNQNDIDGEPEGVYRLDNHAWLFAAPNGKIFHAGPGETMHWIDVNGNSGMGSYEVIGQRAQDSMSMNGGAAMFDIGKILKVGGSPSYSSGSLGNPSAYVIDIKGTTNDPDHVTVTRTANDPEHARIYVSSVVLPNGEVLIMGGLDHAEVFVDEVAYLSAEMFNPETNLFRTLASMQVPRTYHSAAILLKDGRVFMGGGGLCGEGCAANHKDAEIFSPPYLFDNNGELAERPSLKAPDKAFYERTLTVTATPGIDKFSFIRMSSATHSVNNEQRRVPVDFTIGNNGAYILDIPEANLMPPGYYMLFAIDANGVPSVSEVVMVGAPDSRLNGDNLLVEYDFFEGTGALIRDTSGNDNHGEIIEHDDDGNPVASLGDFWTADGLSGNALEMDGMEFNSNSIVDIPTSPAIGAALTNQITVMAWVNRNVDSRLPDGKIPNVAVFTHVGETSSRNLYSSFFLGYHADVYKLEFFTEGGGAAVIYHDGTEDKRYTPGVWEHLVGTYDGTTGIASLYVNGELLETADDVTGDLIINTTESLKSAFTLSGFYELRNNPGGENGNSSGITDELDGRMDKFKLYNIALTQTEIQAIYNEEYKVVVEPDPCDDYYLVYEIGDNSGSGSKEISIREEDSIRLTLNDENVDYVVRGPDGVEITNGIINNITESGIYTVTATLNQLEAVQGVDIHDFCSEEIVGRKHQASLAIDENIKSYWHTLWAGDQDITEATNLGPHNHFIDLDLGVEIPVFEFRYLPRPYDEPNENPNNLLNGTITEYNIYVSSTTDASGDVVWGSPAQTGMWAYNHDLKIVDLGGAVGRYIRLEALETREGAYPGTINNKYASAADIKVMTSKECVQTLEINVVTPKTYIFDNNAWSSSPGDPSVKETESSEFDDIFIESGVAVISKSTSARNITVAPGAALTVDPINAVNLSVRNTLTLNSNSTSYASLIETGYLTGTVIYNRYVNKIGGTSGGGNDLISPPVARNFNAAFVTENEGVLSKHPSIEGIYAFAPFNLNSGKYENFDIGTGLSESIAMVPGKGYRVATDEGGTLSFSGATTKNAVNVPIYEGSRSSWNLIGNPYPSYLDFGMFFEANKDQFEAGEAYQAIYGYTGNSGEWTVWNQTSIGDPAILTRITPGQGFFVKSRVGGGVVKFTPEMRTTGTSDDFIVGRPGNTNVALSKLKLSRASNAVTTSVYFIEGTTKGLDSGYDAAAYGATAVDFAIFTNLLEDNTGLDIAIQSLPYEDFNDVIVPLGIKAKAGAELSISIDDLSTLPSNINVYLEDT
ncbi:galactose oxidase-like domain-containing protein, partial [Gelidibacter sp.]|uniref:galactose oxidase-like domain-containing protein n=1 Tax=Gelidibacter sp. TaxID=2018083 RepID=UPI002C9D95D4